MKKLNFNEIAKVRLTDLGRDIFYHQYDDLNKAYGRNLLKPKMPKVDKDGFTEFQLWHFMQLYGKHIGMAFPNVVEDISFYINENSLDSVDL